MYNVFGANKKVSWSPQGKSISRPGFACLVFNTGQKYLTRIKFWPVLVSWENTIVLVPDRHFGNHQRHFSRKHIVSWWYQETFKLLHHYGYWLCHWSLVTDWCHWLLRLKTWVMICFKKSFNVTFLITYVVCQTFQAIIKSRMFYMVSCQCII